LNGTTYKRCSCIDPATGRPYGRSCPKLRRPGGSWHPTHGIWQYQCELSPTADGRRRPLRRGGFATKAEADTELDRIRTLLALADDADSATRIGDLIAATVSRREPLPTAADARRTLHTDGEHADVTVGEWLDHWIDGRRALRETTRRNYQDTKPGTSTSPPRRPTAAKPPSPSTPPPQRFCANISGGRTSFGRPPERAGSRTGSSSLNPTAA
jgi:hypothetical protein